MNASIVSALIGGGIFLFIEFVGAIIWAAIMHERVRRLSEDVKPVAALSRDVAVLSANLETLTDYLQSLNDHLERLPRLPKRQGMSR